MALTLLLWCYMAALAYVYGEACFALLASRLPDPEPDSVPGAIKWMVGLALLSALTAILNFVVKIGFWANLAVASGGLIVLLANRGLFRRAVGRALESARRLHKFVWALWLAIALVVLLRAADRPLNYDTGLYHAQAIRWIEEYPVVPGLGNLHDPLGYNSAWFPTSALFSFSFLGSQSFRPAGGFLFLLAAAYGLSRLDALLRGEIALVTAGAVLSVFLLRRFLSWELSSPGTDLPATILIWSVFLVSSGKIDRRESHFSLRTSAILILSVFAFMVKINTAPVLILPAFFVLREWRQLPRSAAAWHAALLALMLLPWIGRNIVLSGYLVYPVAGLDVLNMDWKIPGEFALRRVDLLLSWARLPGEDAARVLQMPFRQWAPIWYRQQEPLLRQTFWAIAGGAVLLGGGLSIQYARGRDGSRNLGRYAVLYAAAGVGALVWFLQAPAFRFGYGYLGVLLILLYTPILIGVLQSSNRLQAPIISLIALALLLYQGIGLYNSRDIAGLRPRLVYPVDYPEAQTETRELGNFTVSMPRRGDQCWYAPLPCTPIHNPEVNMRGSGLEDGFFVK